MSFSSPGRPLWKPGDTVISNRFDLLNNDEYPTPSSNNKLKRARKNAKYNETTTTFNTSNIFDKDSSGPKFLILSRVDANEEYKMNTVSPFLIHKAIIHTAGPNVEVKNLKDGTLLLKSTTKQADKLLKLTSLFDKIKVKVEEHKTLNYSKGKIICPLLKYVSDSEILENLKCQNVTELYRIKYKVNGEEKESHSFILTFHTPILPETIAVGYYIARVKPYIPQPMRCFQCQEFGHTTKRCQKKAVCAVCANPPCDTHVSKDCKDTPKCVNCSQAHTSFSKMCEVYKDEFEIQTIKTIKRTSYYAARKEYIEKKNIPPPINTFSQIVHRNRNIETNQIKHTPTKEIEKISLIAEIHKDKTNTNINFDNTMQIDIDKPSANASPLNLNNDTILLTKNQNVETHDQIEQDDSLNISDISISSSDF